ncbi:WD40 repeat domain-containing serine/threonine protein kinase [Dictyobacter alpinus]|nr:WD40 repeat domain-containing serine/threonine protein kinase [Dictyobacter alpinus]
MRKTQKLEMANNDTSNSSQQQSPQHKSVINPHIPDASTELVHGHYEILRKLGDGGFGAVYLARDTQRTRNSPLVALKQINLKDLSPQQIIEATDTYNREVDLLSKFNHPQLPQLRAAFSDSEHWYLTMTYFGGESFESYLKQRYADPASPTYQPFFLQEILEVANELCDVLNYLHAQTPPIIYRDLKPDNLIRTGSGRLFLIDFGIARSFKPAQLKDTIPFGSPGYAAPEQYGKTQTDQRSDIYSLGALLHYLLSGNDPADSPLHFAPLHSTDPKQARLEQLVMRMVSLPADQRPATVNNIIEELHAIEPPASLPTQPKRIGRRQLIAGGLMAGGLLTVALGWKARTDQPWWNNIVYYFDRINHKAIKPVTNLPLPEDTWAWTPIWSPDSRFIATTTQYGQVSIWDVIRQMQTRILQIPSQASHFASWSPNGRYLAIDVNNSTQSQQPASIMLYDTTSWKQLSVLMILPQKALVMSENALSFAFAWSPDSTSLLTNDRTGKIQLWDITTDKSTTIAEGLSNGYNNTFWISVDPTGKLLAFGYGRAGGVILNLKKHNQLMEMPGDIQPPDTYYDRLTTNGVYWSTSIAPLAWAPDGQRVAMIGLNDDIEILDVRTNSSLLSLETSNNKLAEIAWSPDGKYIVARSYYDITPWQLGPGGPPEINHYENLQCWDAQTGKLLGKSHDSEDNTYSASFPNWSPDSQYIATIGSNPPKLYLWKPGW